jgi:hypothetical protein
MCEYRPEHELAPENRPQAAKQARKQKKPRECPGKPDFGHCSEHDQDCETYAESDENGDRVACGVCLTLLHGGLLTFSPVSLRAPRNRASKQNRSEQDQSERDNAGQSEDLPELDPRKIEVRRASGC